MFIEKAFAACLAFAALPLFAQVHPQIEPNAGSWKTWVISSGSDYRVPPPPGAAETQAELRYLVALIGENTAADVEQISHWDAGAPPYRWMDLVVQRVYQGRPVGGFPHRIQTYLALAMYDATIATWESKYAYNRRRPTEMNFVIKNALDVPHSPSYPSEHAAVAKAAATILAHFIPGEADAFHAMAEQAGWSRVRAGLQFPSDFHAGMELGKKIGEAVVAKARADRSNLPWTGTVPVNPPCGWTGTNPVGVTAPNWQPLLLASANEFRPPAPPACTSDQAIAEKEAVRTFTRTFTSNWKAFYQQSPESASDGQQFLDLWAFEDGLHRNPPRVARAYALRAGVFWDAFIASQDGKYTYWYLRPHQLDSRIVPLFPVPNHPSYPSNHSTFSTAQGEILAYLFPKQASFVRTQFKEGGDSRIWAGIHYEMDNVAGVNLGKAVAQRFLEWAKKDGSE